MTSTSSSAVAGRFPSPATKEDEFSCLQDRHDKLLTTCMRLEEELRLLRKHHDKMGDGRHRAEVRRGVPWKVSVTTLLGKRG